MATLALAIAGAVRTVGPVAACTPLKEWHLLTHFHLLTMYASPSGSRTRRVVMPIDWGVNLLRLSVFCSGNTTASDAEWKLLTGQDEADSRATIPGGRRFSGKSAGGLLTLAHAGQRLDLVLQAGETGTDEPNLPVIGPWTDLRGTFSQMAAQLFGSVKVPVVRIAFGSVLLAKKDTLESSYQQLKTLLKSVDVDPKRMRDLHYRVNWQCDSKVIPLKLNRLTTWAAMRFSATLLQVTGDKVTISGAEQEQFAVRLECDHNTDAANQEPFESGKIGTIYQELTELVAENAEKGEIT